MDENKPTFEKIDALTKELNMIFASLEAHISKVETHLRSVELDHMYGNMTEDAYLERKRQINQKIIGLTNMLLELRKAENTLR